MKRVIVFRSALLGLSETFIQQQLLALRDWKPVLAGDQLLEERIDLSGIDLAVPVARKGRLPEFARRFCRKLWLPHPPTARRLGELRADLIHAHFGTDAVDIWPSARAAGLPMLVTLHGYDIHTYRDWWESGRGGVARRSYPRRLVKMAAHPRVRFLAVSEAVRLSAIAFGIPSDKIDVGYIGVDVSAFRPTAPPIAERRERILFVGRLVEKKGAQYLIRAFSALSHTHPGAQLVIAGDGPLRGQLQALAAELDAPVEFLGAVSTVQVKQLMASCRILCLPSVTAANGDAEGLPIIILEALASGLGVVTSARGAVGEAVIDHSTGLCFEPGNVEALSLCLDRFLREPDLLMETGAKARVLACARFDIDACSRRLEDLYALAAGMHGATREDPPQT